MYKLEKLESFASRTGPLLTIIMDGVGIGQENAGNAVYLAKPKNLIDFEKECRSRKLYTQLKAHGSSVGLPSENDMGNSEVGHNAMGSGQIYTQGSKLVNESIRSGSLFGSELWKKITSHVKKTENTIHLIGLLSDGNVHSHIDQLFGILDGLSQVGVEKVRIHPLLDGRDVPSKSALTYIKNLEQKLRKIRLSSVDTDFSYMIASGGGRMYVTMDRYESDWKVVKRGWDAHVRGIIQDADLRNGYKGYYNTAEQAINEGRRAFPDKNDQNIPPFVIVDHFRNPIGKIIDGDAVINFNFRGDRAIQISTAFEDEDFKGFNREYYPKVEYAGLLEYDGDKHIPKLYLVPPPHIKNVLTNYLCAEKITQFAIAETHKFGHVTYFWNGNFSGYVCSDLEEYIEIKSEPSEMIPQNPKMKALEVCEKTVEKLKSGKYKFLRVNFANGDMVGHTGLLDPTITAVKTVDECVGILVKTVNDLNGITVITADHGNADEMKNSDDSPKTSHTLNPVMFMIVDKNWNREYEINPDVDNLGLANIASTVINLLGYKPPSIYEPSLIRFR